MPRDVDRRAGARTAAPPPGAARAGAGVRAGCAGHLDLPVAVQPDAVDDPQAAEPEDDGGDRRRADAADAGRGRQRGAAQDGREHDDHDQRLQHGDERADEKAQRPLSAGGEVERDQHERLDCDSADQVADGEVEVPRDARRRDDGDLGKRARDREQDQPAERFAEVEAPVERVGRLREENTGSPRRPRACSEDHDEEHGGRDRPRQSSLRRRDPA